MTCLEDDTETAQLLSLYDYIYVKALSETGTNQITVNEMCMEQPKVVVQSQSLRETRLQVRPHSLHAPFRGFPGAFAIISFTLEGVGAAAWELGITRIGSGRVLGVALLAHSINAGGLIPATALRVSFATNPRRW